MNQIKTKSETHKTVVELTVADLIKLLQMKCPTNKFDLSVYDQYYHGLFVSDLKAKIKIELKEVIDI